MFRTFNCGIGMTLFVSPQDAEAAVRLLQQYAIEVYHIGQLVNTKNDCDKRVIIEKSSEIWIP